MPIWGISFNDFDEVWEIYEASWEDEARVMEVVSMSTYGQPWPSEGVQTDYSVFVARETIEDAFNVGVRLIKERIG